MSRVSVVLVIRTPDAVRFCEEPLLQVFRGVAMVETGQIKCGVKVSCRWFLK